MMGCGACRLRAKYDKNPGSVLGRVWKWHTRWCPGWKKHVGSLASGEREKVLERYR